MLWSFYCLGMCCVCVCALCVGFVCVCGLCMRVWALWACACALRLQHHSLGKKNESIASREAQSCVILLRLWTKTTKFRKKCVFLIFSLSEQWNLKVEVKIADANKKRTIGAFGQANVHCAFSLPLMQCTSNAPYWPNIRTCWGILLNRKRCLNACV